MFGRKWLARMKKIPVKTLAEVMSAEPELNYEGFNVFGAELMDAEQRDAEMVRAREKLKAAQAEIQACLTWLKRIKRTENINPRHSSNGLKHCVERMSGGYVSNGALIAAALMAGFHFERMDDGVNARFNVDEESVNKYSGV